jgi:hypothetical protein
MLMKKNVTLAAVGVVLVGSMVWAPALANATPNPHGTLSATPRSEVSLAWSASDWREVAARASAAGDEDGARVANTMAGRVAGDSLAARGGSTQNIWTTIAKKAVLQALRYGTNKLPAKIRPYANKLINVVEEIDQFQQGAVVLALTKAGVPSDVAVAAAQWIVIFVGL